MGYLDLLSVVVCPPALLVAGPLVALWRPSARPARRFFALVIVLGVAAGWWSWATWWGGGQGGAAAVGLHWLATYWGLLVEARHTLEATKTLPPGDVWLAAVTATWPVWAPLGLFMGALHALVGVDDNPPAPDDER